MKKFALFFVLFFLAAMSLPAAASIPELDSYIPDEVRESLGEETAAELSVGKTDAGGFFSLVLSLFGDSLSPAAKNLCLLAAVVTIASLFGAYSQSTGSPALSRAVSFCSSLCLILAIYKILESLWESTVSALESLSVAMSAMTVSMTAIQLSGGNTLSAAFLSSSLSACVAALSVICSYILYPMLKVCFGIMLISSLSAEGALSGISSFISKTFTFGIGLVMGIFSIVMSVQGSIAEAADGAAVKTVKFALSASVPIIGGAVGDAARTLGASLSAIRTSLGGIALYLLFALILPPLLSLILNKLALSGAALTAGVIGCKREEAMLTGCSDILNCAIALLIAVFVMFIVCLSLFIRCAPAAFS